jgi:hypothetical protein
MSFRQFGGLNYAAKNNIVSSNYNTSNNLLVTQNVGQPNSLINFESDISGNLGIYGDVGMYGNVDVSGNLNVSGTISAGTFDIGNIQFNSLDISGNLFVAGNSTLNSQVTINPDNISGSGLVIGSDIDLIADNTFKVCGNDGYLYFGKTLGSICYFNNNTSQQTWSINSLGFATFNGPIIGVSSLTIYNNTPPYSGGISEILFNGSSDLGNTATIQAIDVSDPLENSGKYQADLVFSTRYKSDRFEGIHENMRIKGVSGNVGIGTSSPQYTLDVSGVCSATSYNTASDYRIKDNILPLDNRIYNVDCLNPVTYINKLNGKQDIGLIAHELQDYYPFLVEGEKDGEHNQSVNYTGLIGVLIKEIQELKKEVNSLKIKLT